MGPFSDGLDNLFENPILLEIAEKYSKSTGQIILRWLIDRKISLACRSVKEERMIENFDVFDFKLSKEDIEKNQRDRSGKKSFHGFH